MQSCERLISLPRYHNIELATTLRLLTAFTGKLHTLTWHKIKAHTGSRDHDSRGNEAADAAADKGVTTVANKYIHR